jgi:hypothetical protein
MKMCSGLTPAASAFSRAGSISSPCPRSAVKVRFVEIFRQFTGSRPRTQRIAVVQTRLEQRGFCRSVMEVNHVEDLNLIDFKRCTTVPKGGQIKTNADAEDGGGDILSATPALSGASDETEAQVGKQPEEQPKPGGAA